MLCSVAFPFLDNRSATRMLLQYHLSSGGLRSCTAFDLQTGLSCSRMQITDGSRVPHGEKMGRSLAVVVLLTG